jgi:hypothetical protein
VVGNGEGDAGLGKKILAGFPFSFVRKFLFDFQVSFHLIISFNIFWWLGMVQGTKKYAGLGKKILAGFTCFRVFITLILDL